MRFILRLWQLRHQWHRVDEGYIALGPEAQIATDRRFALVIGLIALFLGAGMVLFDALQAGRCHRPSISAYYYDPVAGRVLTIALVAVAAFMVRYRGDNRLDRALAIAGGFLALGVAAFPTVPGAEFCFGGAAVLDLRPALDFRLVPGVDGAGDPVQGLELVQTAFYTEADGVLTPAHAPLFRSWLWAHLASAVLLLLILLYFTLSFLRKRSVDTQDGTPGGAVSRAKMARNSVYLVSALGMVASFVIAVIGMVRPEADFIPGGFAPVFTGEAAALFFFGLAWMVKGRFWRKLNAEDVTPAQ